MMQMRSLALGALTLGTLTLGTVACGDDGGTADGTDSSTTADGTASSTTAEPLTTSSTSPEPETTTSVDSTTGEGSSSGADSTGEPADLEVTLQLEARVGDQPAVCGQAYEGIGSAGTTIEVLDLRFFVSNVRLVMEHDGAEHEVPLAMEDDGEWQLEGSALLDFEDGSGGCSENTTAETNVTVRGTVPAGEYTGVRFDVGLPFEHNHLNADEAPAPLNTTAMFWSWASGYKFAKIDLLNDLPAPDNRWNLHLGSQGCDNGMAGPTVPPAEPCSRPGRPSVSLTGFDPLTGTIVLDVAALFQGADVTADTPDSAPGCMSFMPDALECTPIFENLGLDWATGDCADGCANQIVFHAE